MTPTRTIAARARAALHEPAPAERARIDQMATLLRDLFAEFDLDLSTREAAQSALAAQTFLHANLEARRGRGEIDDVAWRAIVEVFESVAAALVVARTG